MQNIKRDKYYSVNKNKRIIDEMNTPINDRMYNNMLMNQMQIDIKIKQQL